MSDPIFGGDRLPTLETERLRLRWLGLDDRDDIFEVFSSSEVTRYWSWVAYERPEQATALIEEIHRYFALQTLFQWGIERKADAKIIGTVTLADVQPLHRRAEIGFALNYAEWGKGYGGETVERIVGYAFGEMGLHRIEADVDPRNVGSLKVLERFGFQEEGLMRERWRTGGEVCDTIYYALLQPDWSPR